MKKHFASFVFFLLIATAACALAAPKLTNVTAESDSLRAGGEWALTFETTEGGALAMSLRGADGECVERGATLVDAGRGRLFWTAFCRTEARRRTAHIPWPFGFATTGARRARRACCR